MCLWEAALPTLLRRRGGLDAAPPPGGRSKSDDGAAARSHVWRVRGCGSKRHAAGQRSLQRRRGRGDGARSGTSSTAAGRSGGRAVAARGTMAAHGVRATTGQHAAARLQQPKQGRGWSGCGRVERRRRGGAAALWPGSSDARARGPPLFFNFVISVSLGFKGS